MFSVKKRLKAGGAAAFAGAVIMTLFGPVTDASAGELPCGNHTDYLKIKVHGAQAGDWNGIRCFAGPQTAGRVEGWLDEISTGNNDVYTMGGGWNGTDYKEIVQYPRWTWTVFPNRPPQVSYVIIK
ncbi:hypothetical protein GTY75_10455 [Streptomyces sp. SID8381]|uniref:hypothetical protein n=1 Tax=unclassified Streptomyces TaxID=2593676 RepID=UPI00036992AB|nr:MULTISPECIES: hypothetical protein [unclassified Streptomyces]MYX27087.1 hypothetical protein [Streptomyces sp. SID8381]